MINKHYRWLTGSELTFHVEAKSYKCVFSDDQVACMNCRGVQGNTIHWYGKVRKRGDITAGTVLPCFAVENWTRCHYPNGKVIHIE